LIHWAIATSGNYHRQFTIGGQDFSHVIDPRTAQPTSHVVSSSVIAKDSATADALATAFSVLSVQESIPLCKDLQDVECLLVQADGRIVQSDGWPSSIRPVSKFVALNSPIAKSGEIWKDNSKLVVEFEINNASRQTSGDRSHWLEKLKWRTMNIRCSIHLQFVSRCTFVDLRINA
jgi:FAD:protein FMN transferase